MSDNEKPAYVLCSEEVMQFMAENWPDLSPMQHILAFNHCIGNVAAHVQIMTDDLQSRTRIHEFMTKAVPGSAPTDPNSPIINWTPTDNQRLPSCQNPICLAPEELFPDLLDPDGGPNGGVQTIHAKCNVCGTPHIIYIHEETE